MRRLASALPSCGMNLLLAVLLLLVALLPSTIVTAADRQEQFISGCQSCASTGNCLQAFHNGPGKFCGTWKDSLNKIVKPCCCPNDYQCKVSSHLCLCHDPNLNHRIRANHFGDKGTVSSASAIVGQIIGWIVFAWLVCCCFSCCCGGRPRTRTGRSHPTRLRPPPTAPMAEAYPIHSTHSPAVPVSYGSVAAAGEGPGSGGGGAGTFLSGALIGGIVGNIVGWNRHQHRHQGYDDIVGGGDIVGDSGGEWSGDIAGDS